jgi:hypothetical protein
MFCDGSGVFYKYKNDPSSYSGHNNPRRKLGPLNGAQELRNRGERFFFDFLWSSKLIDVRLHYLKFLLNFMK